MRLSLAHINAKAPYVVTEYEEGSVCFITDNGVEYWISFIEETNIGIPYAYQLVIMNQSHTKIKGTDSKIAETVASILFSFFEDERHILFYICDTSDKHEAARHRKFKSWFERFSDPARFAMDTEIISVDESTFFVSAIYCRNSVNEENFLSSFHSYFQELRSKLDE